MNMWVALVIIVIVTMSAAVIMKRYETLGRADRAKGRSETEERLLAEQRDAEQREISGVAVPYDRDAEIAPNFVERIARDAVEDSDDALLFWRHSDPIGKLIGERAEPNGPQHRGRDSDECGPFVG